jgi:hypothetical protein
MIRPISNVYTPMKPTGAASMTQKSSTRPNTTTSSLAETPGGALERMKRVLALREAEGKDGLGTRMLRAEIERWENGEAEMGFASHYLTKVC